MIRGLLRVALVGGLVGWSVDRWLAARAANQGRSGPEPVRTLIVIDGPIDRVWRVVSDIEGQPRWMHDMKSVRILSPGAVGAGTKGEATIRMLGVTVRDPITVSAFEPPDRFAVRHEGRFAGEGVIALEAGADGTTTIVRWKETLVAPMLPWLGAELLRPVFTGIFQRDLERLRDLIERDEA